MFEIYIIYHFEIYDVFVEQISGEEPFIHSSSFVLQRTRLLPFPQENIAKIRRSAKIIDMLPNQESFTKRVNKAISFHRKGCFLQIEWQSEAFLNFYKAIEIISHDFRKVFDNEVNTQLSGTLIKNLTENELKDLRTPKRLIQFTAQQLGITYIEDC